MKHDQSLVLPDITLLFVYPAEGRPVYSTYSTRSSQAIEDSSRPLIALKLKRALKDILVSQLCRANDVLNNPAEGNTLEVTSSCLIYVSSVAGILVRSAQRKVK